MGPRYVHGGVKEVEEGADERNTARLIAACSSESGVWLNAIPCASLSLNLDDSALRVAVGLRMGAPLVLEHKCVCGSVTNKFG